MENGHLNALNALGLSLRVEALLLALLMLNLIIDAFSSDLGVETILIISSILNDAASAMKNKILSRRKQS